jgi:hypothetical protein
MYATYIGTKQGIDDTITLRIEAAQQHNTTKAVGNLTLIITE